MPNKKKAPPGYLHPSRVGTKMIFLYLEQDVFAAFDAAKRQLGVTHNVLGHIALGELFAKLGMELPPSLTHRINDPAPKPPGPKPGHGGRPRKKLGD